MNYKSTQNRVLSFVSISLIILIIVLVSTVFIGEKNDLEREKNLISSDIFNRYESILKSNDKFYKTRLEDIMINDKIFSAFLEKDREKLNRLVQKRWKILKKENPYLKIMHFHLADGTTLLRVHNPKKYGDNIAQKRRMVSHIHKEHKFVSGFEAGIHLLGYRLIMPIFHNNEYIGAVELGSRPEFILNEMKKTKDISGLIFSKDYKIYEQDLLDKQKFRIGDFRLDSSTVEYIDIIKNLPKNYDLNHDIILDIGDRVYGGYIFTHTDFNDNISAKTLIINDITKITQHFYDSILKIVIFLLILYVIFILTIKYGFAKILNQIDSTNLELENSNKKLEKSVAFLKSHQLAMDESSIVSKADLKGNIIYVNDNFCVVTGYSKEEVIGKPHNIIRHPSNSKETFKDMWKTIKSKKVWKGILQNRGKNRSYWVDISIVPILDEQDEIVEYIAVRHDITKMIEQQYALDIAANTDVLTGYGNRYKLNNDIKNSKKPAVAILNIDGFSQINDFYGHKKGDEVIRKVGLIIFNLLKKGECKLYHLQGDEYVIFNEDIASDIFLDKLTDFSKEITTTPVILGEDKLYLNLSVAISFEDKSKILTTADMALKVAKKENKSLVVYSDAISLNSEYQNNIKWAKKIKEALDSDNIVPVFQPIVNNSNQHWEKYEALVRLRDDDRLISPYFFLEISKKTKQYTKITKVMIKKSFDKFKDLDIDFSINLTIEDILNDEINQYIYNMLDGYQIGNRVVFEIVESESIENFDDIATFIDKIKSYGCKIAIDDFGTGYSNFEYLMKVKADFIKIDGSMIKNLDTNSDAQMVVSTIVDFAKKMNMQTIAEFVENESILEKVNELGIDYSQGYHFSAPKEDLK